MIDFDGLLQAPIQTVFSEPVTVTTEGSAIAASGVYSERMMETVEGDTPTTVLTSVLTVQLSSFPEPGLVERLTVRGTDYVIDGDPLTDGAGGADLMLKKYFSP